MEGVVETDSKEKGNKKSIPPLVKVPCWPLGELVSKWSDGSKTESIEWMSVDVEGWELLWVDTMWFDKIKVSVWMIEFTGDNLKKE